MFIRETRTMKREVKNRTLVITDPCYMKHTSSAKALINESTIYGDWSCMCYKCNKEEAKEIYENMKVSVQNVERKIMGIKFELEEALQMLYKLKNENGQQG